MNLGNHIYHNERLEDKIYDLEGQIEELESEIKYMEDTYYMIEKEDFWAFQKYCLELWSINNEEKRKQMLYTLAFLPERKALPTKDFDIL